LYRACPTDAATPRVGDLVCYGRDPVCEGATRAELFDLVLNKNNIPAGAPNCKSISESHCDVVVSVDLEKSKIASVGGNVLQSVTFRNLRLEDKAFTLSTNQGDADCPEQPQPKTPGAKPTSCSLNSKNW